MEAAKSLDSALGGIIVGRIYQVRDDVLNWYAGSPLEPEIRLKVGHFMASIESPVDTNKVWRFLQLNALLPKSKRRQLYPQSSARQGFVCLTEMNLFRILAQDTHVVTINNQEFTEDHIKDQKGLFLYSLLSYDPSTVADLSAQSSTIKWNTKTGSLRKFVFLHQVTNVPYGKQADYVLRIFLC
jgi:hypothetical protein